MRASLAGAPSYDTAIGLLGQVLAEEDWVCVGRRGHPALRRRLSLKAYAGLPHLAISYPDPGGGVGMIDRLLAAGLARRCAATVPHFITLPFHVAQTDCIATLPRPLAIARTGALVAARRGSPAQTERHQPAVALQNGR